MQTNQGKAVNNCDHSEFVRRNEFEGRGINQLDPKTDLEKCDGVEFVLGRCKKCGSWLMSCWIDAVGRGAHEKINDEFVTLLDQNLSDPKKIRQILSNWWSSISG